MVGIFVYGDGLGYEKLHYAYEGRRSYSRKPSAWCLKKERKNPVGKPREMEFLDIN